MTYRIVNGNIVSVKPLDIDSSKANINKDASKTSFSEILNKKLNKDINISKLILKLISSKFTPIFETY